MLKSLVLRWLGLVGVVLSPVLLVVAAIASRLVDGPFVADAFGIELPSGWIARGLILIALAGLAGGLIGGLGHGLGAVVREPSRHGFLEARGWSLRQPRR